MGVWRCRSALYLYKGSVQRNEIRRNGGPLEESINEFPASLTAPGSFLCHFERLGQFFAEGIRLHSGDPTGARGLDLSCQVHVTADQNRDAAGQGLRNTEAEIFLIGG